jgi:hypothetical protein
MFLKRLTDSRLWSCSVSLEPKDLITKLILYCLPLNVNRYAKAGVFRNLIFPERRPELPGRGVDRYPLCFPRRRRKGFLVVPGLASTGTHREPVEASRPGILTNRVDTGQRLMI